MSVSILASFASMIGDGLAFGLRLDEGVVGFLEFLERGALRFDETLDLGEIHNRAPEKKKPPCGGRDG
jgi:hypothetical protein